MMLDIKKETLFMQLEKMCDGGVSEERSKAMITDIINIFRKQELTYNQAFEVLNAVNATLSVMSESLAI